MTDECGFVYMDDASIDDEFKCLICNEPFEKATCTPCDHTFCRLCIEQWLRKNTDDNKSCPICRHSLSIEDDLKPASRLITNRIDRYLVKCLACDLEKIPRGSFSDHISKTCTKTDVCCSASDILCPWIGPRYQLNDHLKLCPYQQIRPILELIQTKNTQLEQVVTNQQQQIISINERYQAQQLQIDELTKTVDLLKAHKNITIKRTINFDDLIEQYDELDSYYPIPSNYAGFTWHNGAFMPHQHGKISYPNTGFDTAFKQNNKCVIFNFGCQPITMCDSRNTFSILSFEATCAFQDKVILTVVGRRAGKTIHTITFTLRYHELKTFNLNWDCIDELEFLPKGGKQLPTVTDTDRHVILTCLNFS
ncbi:unnamed protein product [Rotaria sp. Silwood1]|nr:unnamed protein product [Rotaria sp. Silwood1]CAF1422537.1 unnamed protein product [Rotaria sp. Silwood1]CAF3558493.1 unnamed protein product [Rotaria sp. Silwood1]CAF3629023.1 unnamed protein product [Rotaria sp. Silwood1]CAF5090572.1 unnamed protein product [Rotaria sp. Silwood1]